MLVLDEDKLNKSIHLRKMWEYFFLNRHFVPFLSALQQSAFLKNAAVYTPKKHLACKSGTSVYPICYVPCNLFLLVKDS